MTPSATYRLQLQPDFPFAAAAKAVPYVAALGVSHLHLSPVLEAVPGSTHGYDVVDHSRVREELGGEEGLRLLADRAREHGLGIVLDIVPNHMATAPRHNKALWEVLREGPASPYARWFDIDWAAGGGKLLLPVLPGPAGGELDELRVVDGELCHGEQRFPLAAGTEELPLPELLDAQHYRPAWWRLGRTELNYRRFFTISELIGVRVEDPEVFAATHAKILELVRDGVVDGLRIDHPDGLADPEAYLRRLNEETGGACWTVVEKILTGDEPLPASWPVAGTTGYDALHRIDGLFTDPVGADELALRFRDFTGPAGDRGGYWEATVRRAMYKVVIDELAAETEALGGSRTGSARPISPCGTTPRGRCARRSGSCWSGCRCTGRTRWRAGPAGSPTRRRCRRRPRGRRRRRSRCRRSRRRSTSYGSWRSAGWAAGRTVRRSARGSPRRRRRCARRPWRTRRSTAMCRCCRRTRWAAIRGGPR